MTLEEFQYLVGLDLGKKIARTVTQMMLFNSKYGGYVSLSGGRGSTVLADINVRYGLNLPLATVANCEEPENLVIAKSYGTNFIVGTRSFREIVTKYGYPMISKKVAMSISRYSKTKSEEQRQYYLKGKWENGKYLRIGMIPYIYQFMIHAPFEVSEQCCDFKKKNPLKKFAKDNGLLPITAEMSGESRDRAREYMSTGCIQPGKKCTPMGFWTEKDLNDYIELNSVKISAAYDDPTCTRTGCPICGFGLLKDPTRFDRMKRIRPNTFDHYMDGGMWIEKDLYRFVRFRPASHLLIWSNKYWVPSPKGYGMQFVIDYINRSLEKEKKEKCKKRSKRRTT